MDLVVNVLYARFSRPDISAFGPKMGHSLKCKLPQVSLLNSAGDQRHGNVPLDPVDSYLQGM